jgi:hypothetical protein
MRLKTIQVLLGIVLCNLAQSVFSQQPTDAKAVEAKFQTEVAARIEKPYQAAVAGLNKDYLASVERARSTAQQKGALDEALALQAEAERISKGTAPPSEDDDKTPASLRNLRSAYRRTFAKLESDKAARLRPFADSHIAALNAIIAELTRQGKLAEATEARAIIERIKDAGPQTGRPLKEFLVGTKWLWNGSPANELAFLEDGTVGLADWTNRGLVTGWKVSGKNTVKLTILKGRENNTTATLDFSEDRTSFTGIDFNGRTEITKSPRVTASVSTQ